MKKAIVFLSSLLALSACQTTKAVQKNVSPITLTTAQIEAVKAGVARGMKDPESARFGPTFNATTDHEVIHVCGYVNGKNSFGGYVGMAPFYAMGDTKSKSFTGMAYGGSEVNTAVAVQMCAEAGIKP